MKPFSLIHAFFACAAAAALLAAATPAFAAKPAAPVERKVVVASDPGAAPSGVVVAGIESVGTVVDGAGSSAGG